MEIIFETCGFFQKITDAISKLEKGNKTKKVIN